jgi:hypothetical protein
VLKYNLRTCENSHKWDVKGVTLIRIRQLFRKELFIHEALRFPYLFAAVCASCIRFFTLAEFSAFVAHAHALLD